MLYWSYKSICYLVSHNYPYIRPTIGQEFEPCACSDDNDDDNRIQSADDIKKSLSSKKKKANDFAKQADSDDDDDDDDDNNEYDEDDRDDDGLTYGDDNTFDNGGDGYDDNGNDNTIDGSAGYNSAALANSHSANVVDYQAPTDAPTALTFESLPASGQSDISFFLLTPLLKCGLGGGERGERPDVGSERTSALKSPLSTVFSF